MSTDMLLKCFFVAVLSSILSWTVFSRYDTEVGDESLYGEGQRYLPYFSSLILPAFLVVIMAFALPAYGVEQTLQMTLSLCFGIFLHISVYYLLLMLLLPVLRRFISSRACATLWIIPNYLYITYQSSMAVPEPLLVVRLKNDILWVLLCIWLTGFAVILLLKIAEHLRFRRRILKNAKVVTQANVIAVWDVEIANARIKKPKYRLVTSPDVNTPLSVGFFDRAIRVVLPERAYTEEELSLIFRHELIHICRSDSANKFFLVFCAAMCWFNPLMWIAKRRSADDMELSCDETVLLGADDGTRRKYADLILRTAADEQGFTTCLSASADALRYRLKHIVKPRKLRSGAIIVGLMFFVLCMTSGYVALAYGATTGEEVLFPSTDNSVYEIETINYREKDTYFAKCTDSAVLKEYLSGLSLSCMTGNYSFNEDSRRFQVFFNGPEGSFVVELQERMLTLIPLGASAGQTTKYYLDTSLDWDYLFSLMAKQEDTSTLPALSLEFDDPSLPSRVYCNGAVTNLFIDGKAQPEEDWWSEEVSSVILSDTTASRVIFHFSQNLYPDPYMDFEVRIEELWGDGEIRTIYGNQLDELYTIPLASYSAVYTVCASFAQENTIYEMEFSFRVERPE